MDILAKILLFRDMILREYVFLVNNLVMEQNTLIAKDLSKHHFL